MWLWNEWFNPNSFYSYCAIVPLISGMLIYQEVKAVGFHLKKLIFPIGFLVFMFPLPDAWTIEACHHLKIFSTKLASLILNLIQVHCLAENNLIYLPHGMVI